MSVHIRGKMPKQDQTVTVEQSASMDIRIDVGRNTNTGGKALDMYTVLQSQPAFYTMASCFDQCKIKQCWARIVIHTIEPASACAEGRTPLLVCAWDRNGVGSDADLSYSAISNYSSAKTMQLGSLIVGKPLDTGISA